MQWIDNHIEVDPPKRPKKLTGTRLAAVLGLNKWNSPFQTWCEVTRTYEKPFEDTIYTLAGKAIEPKQAEYMKRMYGMYGLVTPAEKFGENYFNKTFGDFFHDTEIFGGMWDYLVYENGELDMVLEMKTTKRSEDWQDDIPEYYAMQAALYAYLLGTDSVCMVCSFLEDKDYEHPELFVPSAENTIIRPFRVSKRYPNFELILEEATEWWNQHVRTGVSPDYDEKVDKEYLEALRNENVQYSDEVVAEAEALKKKIDAAKAAIADDEKRYKAITEAIKAKMMDEMKVGSKTATVTGKAVKWTLSRSERTTIDEDKLKSDGLYDSYKVTKETYTLRAADIKEAK